MFLMLVVRKLKHEGQKICAITMSLDAVSGLNIVDIYHFPSLAYRLDVRASLKC